MRNYSFILFLALFQYVVPLHAQNIPHAFLPIEFIANEGQWAGDFLFKGNNPYADIYIKKNGLRIIQSAEQNHEILEAHHHGKKLPGNTLKFHVYDMQFEGCNEHIEVEKNKIQKHYYNYFLGKDRSTWKSNIHPCQNVDLKNMYNGIDIHLYSEAGNAKYDIIAKPFANMAQVKIKYDGVESLSLEKKKLLIKTSIGTNTELAPYAYQLINDEKVEVACEYQLHADHTVSFQFPNGYDKKQILYVDPVMIFARLTNSPADNWGFTATFDGNGNFYAGGISNSIGYITTVGAFDVNFNGGSTTTGGGFPSDAVISKYDATGNTLIYGTYIGGLNNDQPHSIFSRADSALVIVGRTYSTDFPISATGKFQTLSGDADLFVFVLSNDGTTNLGSTYMGGSGQDGVNITPIYTSLISLKHNYGDDARSEVIADNSNNIYVAASSSSANFPTQQANQGIIGGLQDGVIFELNPDCSSLLWSTFIGGTNDDACYVLSFDKTNNNILYVAGGTESNTGIPTNAGTISQNFNGVVDGFILKIDAPTKTITKGTYIGTNSYDQIYGIQTDDSNHVYVMGQTQGAFPVIGNPFTNPGSSQFVAKIDNNLSTFLVSTVYGSGTTAFTNISPVAFLVDKCQNVYVSGWGGNTGGNPGNTLNMPLSTNAYQSTTDGLDFYFIVFDKNLQNLLYATYYGQNSTLAGEHVDGGTSRFDPNGIIYQAVCAACGGSTFPTTLGSSTSGSPNCNLGCIKLDFQLQNPNAVANFQGDSIGCSPFQVDFLNNSTSSTGYIWNFGDGSPTTTQTNPSHTYTTPGTYVVTLIASNPNGCTSTLDTATLVVKVKNDAINASFTSAKVDSCGPFTANFNNNSTYNGGIPPASSSFFWDFGDGSTYNGINPPLHSFPAVGVYNVKLVMVDTNACHSPDSMVVVINFSSCNVLAEFIGPDSVCMPLSNFVDQSTNATTWNWTFGDGGNATATNPSHAYTAQGTYQVILIAGNPASCNKLDTAQQSVTVFPSPIADFDWSPDPPQVNTPTTFTNTSVGATSYLWDFGDGATSTKKDEVHAYNKDGEYNVCLTAWNVYGCPDTVCKKVRGLVVPLVDVPTGFSPNGDGINDFVYVKGYGIEKMTFRIYNRWGQKVFESTDKAIGWDGRYKGQMQEMEVYAYTLSVDFFDGTSTFKKGNITLLK
ncbi:MAG: PKD domain-containing protein [Chitinophagaceae bacterium]